MKSEIKMHDLVALLEEVPAHHFSNGAPLLLRRGLIGTVVMTYDGTTYEVEFCDAQGRAVAMLPVAAGKLIVLNEASERAVA